MHTPNRRDFLKHMGTTLAAATFGGARWAKAADTQSPDRPNIVFILSDDQGWADIGYHNPEIRTPVLDKLARKGVELDCHYVQPQCTPTRVALLTGRYPSRFGGHCTKASNEQAYPVGTPTMARMLKSMGYKTALAGKWHMGSTPEWGPNHHGFDHSYGSLAGAVGMYDHRYRLNSPYAKTWHRNHEFVDEEGHATDLVTREAVRWIEREHDGPFFLYVPFQAVHTPLVAEDKWIEKNAHIEDADRRLFAACVSHMDACIGRIVEALKRTGQRENTLIIFSSDNGAQVNHRGGAYPEPDPKLKNFSSNAPLRGQKTEACEGGIRVPAFLNWPGRLAPRKVTAPMHIVDWMPSLAALTRYAGGADPAWDGMNIWPLVTGQAAPEPRRIYTVWHENRRWEALRSGGWKIVRHRGKSGKYAPWELYDVGNDPNETTDLAGKKPDVLERLIEEFEQEKKKDAPDMQVDD